MPQTAILFIRSKVIPTDTIRPNNSSKLEYINQQENIVCWKYFIFINSLQNFTDTLFHYQN